MKAPAGYLTTKDAADALGLYVNTMPYRIARGEIPAVKHGRHWFIAISDVEAALAAKAGVATLDHAARRIAELEANVADLRALIAGPSTPQARQRRRAIRAEFELANQRRRRGHISKRVRWLIFERDGHRCVHCGATALDAKLTIDHLLPVADGGTDDPGNLVTACWDCNEGRGDRPLMSASAEIDEREEWPAILSAIPADD